ncbi:MAG TPA: flagellar assembly protein FliW [Verrucomicrobiae bacterium]
MIAVESPTLEMMEAERENIVQLPLGLLGFETIKEYVLLTEPGQEPFRWLQVLNDPSLAFLVVPPFDVLPDYAPQISPEDARFLGLVKPSDALLYNIVTLRNTGATVNLKGPIVINRYTLRGKQVVIANAANYSLQHPLPAAEEA